MNTVWVLVRRPILGGDPEIVGAFRDDTALYEAARTWREKSVVNSADFLTAQSWVDTQLTAEVAVS